MDYQHLEHRIEIVSHDRDYSNVGVHGYAMLSTKSEGRLTADMDARSKKKKKLSYLNL